MMLILCSDIFRKVVRETEKEAMSSKKPGGFMRHFDMFPVVQDRDTHLTPATPQLRALRTHASLRPVRAHGCGGVGSSSYPHGCG